MSVDFEGSLTEQEKQAKQLLFRRTAPDFFEKATEFVNAFGQSSDRAHKRKIAWYLIVNDSFDRSNKRFTVDNTSVNVVEFLLAVDEVDLALVALTLWLTGSRVLPHDFRTKDDSMSFQFELSFNNVFTQVIDIGSESAVMRLPPSESDLFQSIRDKHNFKQNAAVLLLTAARNDHIVHGGMRATFNFLLRCEAIAGNVQGICETIIGCTKGWHFDRTSFTLLWRLFEEGRVSHARRIADTFPDHSWNVWISKHVPKDVNPLESVLRPAIRNGNDDIDLSFAFDAMFRAFPKVDNLHSTSMRVLIAHGVSKDVVDAFVLEVAKRRRFGKSVSDRIESLLFDQDIDNDFMSVQKFIWTRQGSAADCVRSIIRRQKANVDWKIRNGVLYPTATWTGVKRERAF